MVEGGERREPPAIIFLVILLPFGMVSGFVGGALAFLLHKNGFSTAAIGALVGLSTVPQTVKFFWAPLVDGVFSNKLWYVGAAVVSGLGILAISAAPTGAGAMPLLSLLAVLTSVSQSLSGMTADSLMAHTVSPARKGRAAGWAQAGNVGGGGLSAGGGIWLGAHLPSPWMAGAVIGAVIAACCGALLLIPEPVKTVRRESYLQTLRAIVGEVWAIIASRGGLLVIWIFILPLGTGAAGSILSAVAGEWRVKADLLAALTGAGGLASMAGAIAGGHLVDAMDRKGAYALAGGLSALSAIALAAAPRTPVMFVVFTSLYAFIVGVCYAAYFGVTLEAAGRGAAATKCTLLASLSNVPIAYMAVVDGDVQSRWGSATMLMAEAAAGLGGIALYYLAEFATRRWRPARR